MSPAHVEAAATAVGAVAAPLFDFAGLITPPQPLNQPIDPAQLQAALDAARAAQEQAAQALAAAEEMKAAAEAVKSLPMYSPPARDPPWYLGGINYIITFAAASLGLVTLSIATEDLFPTIKKTKELQNIRRQQAADEETRTQKEAREAAELEAFRTNIPEIPDSTIMKDDNMTARAEWDPALWPVSTVEDEKNISSSESEEAAKGEAELVGGKGAGEVAGPTQLFARTSHNIIGIATVMSISAVVLIGVFVGCGATFSMLQLRF